MTKIIYILSTLGLFLAGCGSNELAGGDHGTDRPNALTFNIRDSKGSALQAAQVRLRTTHSGTSQFLTCNTNVIGQCSISIPRGDTAKSFQVIKMVDAPTDTLYFARQVISDSLQSDYQVQLNQNLVLDSSLTQGDFRIYYEIYPSTDNDICSPKFDSSKINAQLNQIHSLHGQGFSFAIFSSLSSCGDLPTLDSEALARLQWVKQKAIDLDLKLHLIAHSNADNQLPQSQTFALINRMEWSQTNYAHKFVNPFATVLCDKAGCFSDYNVEFTQNAEIFGWSQNHSIALTLSHNWHTQFPNHFTGLGLGAHAVLDLYKLIESSDFESRDQFLVLNSQIGIDLENTPAYQILPDRKILVRLNSSEIYASRIEQLKSMHYQGVLVPLP